METAREALKTAQKALKEYKNEKKEEISQISKQLIICYIKKIFHDMYRSSNSIENNQKIEELQKQQAKIKSGEETKLEAIKEESKKIKKHKETCASKAESLYYTVIENGNYIESRNELDKAIAELEKHKARPDKAKVAGAIKARLKQNNPKDNYVKIIQAIHPSDPHGFLRDCEHKLYYANAQDRFQNTLLYEAIQNKKYEFINEYYMKPVKSPWLLIHLGFHHAALFKGYLSGIEELQKNESNDTNLQNIHSKLCRQINALVAYQVITLTCASILSIAIPVLYRKQFLDLAYKIFKPFIPALGAICGVMEVASSAESMLTAMIIILIMIIAIFFVPVIACALIFTGIALVCHAVSAMLTSVGYYIFACHEKAQELLTDEKSTDPNQSKTEGKGLVGKETDNIADTNQESTAPVSEKPHEVSYKKQNPNSLLTTSTEQNIGTEDRIKNAA